MSGKRRQPRTGCFPCPLYPPVQHIFVDTQIRRYMAYRFLVLFGQRCRFGFELRGVCPPFSVFLSLLFLSLCYISRLSLCLPIGGRSKFEHGDKGHFKIEDESSGDEFQS
jgi:hypothetical protein